MLPLIFLSLLNLNNRLEVEVWVDKEDCVYYPGENLKIFFRASEDCFVSVYDIEVGGRENLLFPLEGEDGWIEKDRVYELPPSGADYDYAINGPEGVETIVCLASTKQSPGLIDEDPDVVREAVEIFIKEPEPAKLRIITTPKNCRIYIIRLDTDEEEYIGRTPRTIVMMPGEYRVRIKKFRYRTLTRRVVLGPGSKRRVFVRLWRY